MITADLREAGWKVGKNAVAGLMAEMGLAARQKKRSKGATRPGKGRWRAPDLVRRNFPAAAINEKWYGDGTEIGTDEGTLYLDRVMDVGSRRVLGFAWESTTAPGWPTARWPWRWRCAAAPRRA